MPATKALGEAVALVARDDVLELGARHCLEYLLDSAYAEHVAAVWLLKELALGV
jgi:hypothetical protein